MRLTSPAFDDGGVIPQKYGRNFKNVNPSLVIGEVPDRTISFVLTMEDPDIPAAAGVPVWDHWILFNIPAETREIPEAWQPTGVRGKGTRGELEYGGPRPPDREHRYFFRIYALDGSLYLPEGSSKKQVMDAAKGHILETTELMGRFRPS